MKKIAVLTSGGDSPGMNACIRAIVKTATHYNMEVLGFYRGYDGIIDKNYIQLDRTIVHGIIHRGGTILKSARSERFRTPAGIK
ncbi:MAG: 6-phosphofructokinase, partial [Bacteroidia bacterium]